MTSSSPFSGNHHTCITTPDIARQKDFYCRFFGFDDLTEMQWEAGNALADAICGLLDTAVKMVLLRLNNTCLEIFEFIQPASAAAHGRFVQRDLWTRSGWESGGANAAGNGVGV